jgi:DNA invertase Pin-like site-specific DNA recombinase
MDFAKLVDVFDANEVTFVSVTQSFNTTTSMGRLTLNILLSFAQFEREVIGERIRDKFAASRARGMWMGGWAPLGYDIRDRKLVVNEAEAALVRRIFERFVRLGSATQLVAELASDGVQHKRGKPIDKGFVYKLLNNRLYLGDASTRARAILASTTPSSPRISGTRWMPSSARAPASGRPTRGRKRRRCCRV